MSVEQTITQRLTEAFAPVRLTVRNDSHLHAGHAASPGTGDSHFHVAIVSATFQGVPRVERHRMINAALEPLLSGPVHALSISALAPEEAEAG